MRSPGVDSGAREISALTLWKQVSAAITGLKNVSERLCTETKVLGATYRQSRQERRDKGYAELIGALKGIQAKTGVTQGKESVTNVRQRFDTASLAILDAATKTAVDRIKTELLQSANAATTVGGKRSALVDAQKKVANLATGATGADKATLDALSREMKTEAAKLQPYARVDNSIAGTISKIDASGGANIRGADLTHALGDLETRLLAVTRHIGGAEGNVLKEVIGGVGKARKAAGGGFKGLHGESKDIIKGAFELSGTVQINDALADLAAQFTSTTSTLRDAGLQTALNAIKTAMEGAAGAANDTKGKLKALGDAQEQIKQLAAGTARGGDKDALDNLQRRMRQMTTELRKSTQVNPVHKFFSGAVAKLQNGFQTLGRTLTYLGPLKRSLDGLTGAFSKVNTFVNKFARMQIGITSERAGFGRQLRGSGIRFPDIMGALAAGRSAGMDDHHTVNTMVGLQGQIAQARWGEGTLINAAGRWGLSPFKQGGGMKTSNEMMIDFSRKLKSLGSDLEKLQFLSHLNFRPEEREFVENYEDEAKRMEKVKANPHLQTIFDKANIMDESGESARIDKYTKLEQKRRQILNQNAIDQGPWAAIKRSMNPENWFFSDWTARQKGVERAKSEVGDKKMQATLDAMLNEIKKNGGDREAAMQTAIGQTQLNGDDLKSLVDAMKHRAEEMNDPSLMRDFEATFKNVTGMTIDTRTNMEKLCETLNETFESIVEWAEEAVEKLSEWLGKEGPKTEEGKSQRNRSFWAKEAGTGAIVGAAEGTAYAVYKGSDALVKHGQKLTNEGGFRKTIQGAAENVVGRVGEKAAKVGGGVAAAWGIWDTIKNWNEASEEAAEAEKAYEAAVAEEERLNKEAKERGGGESLPQYAEGGRFPEKGEVRPISSENLKEYAKGGRSSRKAIFGEAGPEYAIPVEHTSRTADLLNRAAKESGFGNPGIGRGDVYKGDEESLPQYAEGGRFPEKGEVGSLSADEKDRLWNLPMPTAEEYKQHKGDTDWWKQENARRAVVKERLREQKKAREASPKYQARKRTEEEIDRRQRFETILGGVGHGLNDAVATSFSSLFSGYTLGLWDQDNIKHFLTTEDFRKKQAEIDEEHPNWAVFKHGSGTLAKEAQAYRTGGWALGGLSRIFRAGKATISGMVHGKDAANLTKTIQQTGQTFQKAKGTLSGAGDTMLAKKAAQETARSGTKQATKLAGQAAREKPATLAELAQKVRAGRAAQVAVDTGSAAKGPIAKMFDWTKSAAQEMAEKAKGLGEKLFGKAKGVGDKLLGKAEKVAPTARQKIAGTLSKEAARRANLEAGGMRALKQKAADNILPRLRKVGEWVKTHKADTVGATLLPARAATEAKNANSQRIRAATEEIERRNEKRKKADAEQAKAKETQAQKPPQDSAEAKRVKAMETKEFLNHVRRKMEGGAKDEELKEIFGYKGLTNVNLDNWRSNKLILDPKKNKKGKVQKDKQGNTIFSRKSNAEAEKLLAGEFMQQENIEASLKAGKAVDVGKEMANLTDKYALAWKESGKSFTDKDQRVAIAARQNGASGATTFAEMKHYFDEGDKYGQKQTELLAKIAAALKQDDNWKDKSDQERLEEAKRRRREEFIKGMSAEDLHNRFKYDENGNEIKDENKINENVNKFFKENNIKRSFKQEFDPEKIKRFKDYMNSDEAKANDFATNIAKFSDKTGLNRSDVRTIAAKAIGMGNLTDEQREEVMKSKEVKQMAVSKKAQDREAEWKRLGEEKTKTISLDEATNAFRGDKARAKSFIDMRDKVQSGGELNEEEKKRFEQYKRMVGYHEWSSKQGQPVGATRSRVRPRTTRKGHNMEAFERWKSGYEERRTSWARRPPQEGRTFRGKELLAERERQRKEEAEKKKLEKKGGGTSGSRFGLGRSTKGRSGGGLTLGKSAGKLTLGSGGKLTLGTGGKLTLGKEPHVMSLGGRGRGGKLSLETSSYKPERAPSRAYNPSKVAAAELAAASGNRARNGGLVSEGGGGTGGKGGGVQNYNTSVQFTANLHGVDFSKTNELQKVLEDSAQTIADKVNNRIATAQTSAVRSRSILA